MSDHEITDWNLIRKMLQLAIDFCEALEESGNSERDQGTLLRINEQDVTLSDLVTSAWVLPEKLRHQIIRDRHDHNDDLPYVPETSRIIIAMAQAAAELVAAKASAPASVQIQNATNWYDEFATPTIKTMRKLPM